MTIQQAKRELLDYRQDAEEIKDIIREALSHPNSMYHYQLVSFDGMAFRNVETVFERNQETIHREETDYER